METIKGSRLVAISATLLVISAILVKGQIRTPCTTSMINSFTPCFNFITGSSNNGSSPTSDCCSSLQSLTSTSVDCACLVLTANVPVQLPINRTLALSLPQACNMAVPVQCKAQMMVKVKAYDAMKTMKRSREDVNSVVFPSDVSPPVDGMPDAEVVVAPAGASSEESAGEPTGGVPLAPASP
ncbi:protein yls3 [Quercus suber]|uniref:Protein yls3 n=1 Tax=Quercus suber TaxID=58331 RepID=A0AAW0KZ65_QUESU